jgi:transposase
MNFVGIDIASETHFVATVDEQGQSVLKPTSFTEDAQGYGKLHTLLPAPAETLIALEATGHYWQNLFAYLIAEGYRVALLNPLRTHSFAREDLRRAKTDALDALAIARFALQKRPPATTLPDEATRELRELVRLRDRLVQDFGDRTRQLHRLVDLGFPEFTRYVKRLDSGLASTILAKYPTARAFQDLAVEPLANLVYDGRHRVGAELAKALIEAAKSSVGQHHTPAYQLQVRYTCEDLELLRQRLRSLEADIEQTLRRHEVGSLLTTIPGIGPQTAARLIAQANPTDFVDASHLASYVGVVSGTSRSGKRQALRAHLTPIGNASLRAALWMPTLNAVRYNPWLGRFYQGLLARGKLPKVALVAAMHKLLAAVYSVAKHRQPFVPKLPGQEALPVTAGA